MMPSKIIKGRGSGMARESVQSAKASRARAVQTPTSRSAGQKKADGAAAKPAAKPRLASIGICCTLAWAFLINAAGGEASTGQLSWRFSHCAGCCYRWRSASSRAAARVRGVAGGRLRCRGGRRIRRHRAAVLQRHARAWRLSTRHHRMLVRAGRLPAVGRFLQWA